MNSYAQHRPRFVLALATALFAVSAAYGRREKPKRPDFKYVGGTEAITGRCEGILEVTSDTLTFKCPAGSVSAPYSAITQMEYRTGLSRQVRQQKVNWKVKPPHGSGRTNHLFTVLFSEGNTTHAIVLAVSPQAIRPYLAEIDLKAGKRVEVQSHENY